jgi:ABC-type branched-subunit amino acid transport system substrate-binding protein
VTWSVVPLARDDAASARDAFVASAVEAPDAILGFVSADALVRAGPTVARTRQPTFALSAPPDAVRTGPSGGDNVFLVRALDAQIAAKLLAFACTDLRKRLHLDDVRLALDLGLTGLSAAVQDAVPELARSFPRCRVVVDATAPADAPARAVAIRDAGADVVVSASAAASGSALLTELRDLGVTVPVVGGSAVTEAVASGAITNLAGLWVVDDCVPEIVGGRRAARFVRGYTAQHGATPSGLAARAYDGVCGLRADRRNVLARSATVHRYAGPTDPTGVRVRTLSFDR